MIDVTPTLRSVHPFVPKFLNAAMSSSLVRGFTFDSRYNFSSCQTFSIGLRSGLSGGVRHQLMSCLSKKAWAHLGVFRIIVLHKTMVWQSLINEQNQSILKDVTIQIGLHYSLENTDFCGATPADASPDMNLKWVFRFWLSLCWFINLSIAYAAKLLKRDGAFVQKDDIIECISRI